MKNTASSFYLFIFFMRAGIHMRRSGGKDQSGRLNIMKLPRTMHQMRRDTNQSTLCSGVSFITEDNRHLSAKVVRFRGVGSSHGNQLRPIMVVLFGRGGTGAFEYPDKVNVKRARDSIRFNVHDASPLEIGFGGGGGGAFLSAATVKLLYSSSTMVYFFSLAGWVTCGTTVREYLPVMATVRKNTGRVIRLKSSGPWTTPAGTKIILLRLITSLLPSSHTVISALKSCGSSICPPAKQITWSKSCLCGTPTGS